jgi:CubicO group peptidase (beta-lactamase class C family)
VPAVPRLLASLLLVLFAFESRTVSLTVTTADPRIDRFVRAEMDRQRVPGVAVAIVKNGAVTKAQGYGYANVEHMVPVGPETIFQSGSLGKQFTAAAVMLQVESGRLSLTDPITKFFPEAPSSWRSITVRHLLTHTSGIPDYTTETFDYRKDYTEDQLARFAYALTPEFPPGSRWSYSNTGYLLLGVIVHQASGRFYGDVLADDVFKPLGMSTARIISEADIVPHRAAGYRLEKGELKNQEWVSPSLNTTADGALYFSVRDLIAWDAGVRARRVLRAESWNEVLTPVRLTSGKTYPYGFGWAIDERGGKPLHQHSGSWQGFKTRYSRFVGDDLSIIVLANLREADPTRFVDGIAAILNPSLAVPVPTPIEDLEPQVTARMKRFVDAARRGALSAADFAYVDGFFAGEAQHHADELKAAGELQRTTLLERKLLGDDRVYLYELGFAARTLWLRLGLAPDDRIVSFSITQK